MVPEFKEEDINAMNNTMLSAILWIAAGVVFVLLVMRRRRRRLVR